MTEIARSRVGVNIYLVPPGSLADALVLDALQEAVKDCLDSGETQLILDLSNVPTLNSRVLELFLEWRDQLLPKGGTLTLVNGNPLICEVLEITGVGNFITVANRSGNDDQQSRPFAADQQRKRLGDLLLQQQLVSAEKIDKALQLQAITGKRMGAILVDKGWVSETALLKILGLQLGIPYIHLRPGIWDPALARLIDQDTLQQLNVLPLFKVHDKLILATCDPQDLNVFDELRQLTGCVIKPVLAKKDEIAEQYRDAVQSDVDIAEYLTGLENDFEVLENAVPEDYAAIDELSSGSPVINLVKEMIGLTFAKVLKHVLRQDPDIIMVGEIRERETAEIAVQAALTGHLVLSTLHTNESTGAVTRLMEMGIEPYLLSSSLIGVVAQRLVRSICQECKTSYIASSEEIARYGWQEQGQVRLQKGRGCPVCYDSRYKGRLATHEILPVDPALQKLMVGNPSQDDLKECVQNSGMKTLYDDGLERVLQGRTTIEEISRVIVYD